MRRDREEADIEIGYQVQHPGQRPQGLRTYLHTESRGRQYERILLLIADLLARLIEIATRFDRYALAAKFASSWRSASSS